jgi:hypothetical protein
MFGEVRDEDVSSRNPTGQILWILAKSVLLLVFSSGSERGAPDLRSEVWKMITHYQEMWDVVRRLHRRHILKSHML